MKAPGIITTCGLILLFAAACGLNGGSQEVRSEAPTVLNATPAQAPAPTTTAAAPPDTAPSSPKEPPLPDGARHGDQPEVVSHFGTIDADGDCDWLRTERDADQVARDALLAQRDSDPAARPRAELADRWMQAAQNRMRNLRCPVQTPMAGTP